jgi:hypothetical protein
MSANVLYAGLLPVCYKYGLIYLLLAMIQEMVKLSLLQQVSPPHKCNLGKYEKAIKSQK